MLPCIKSFKLIYESGTWNGQILFLLERSQLKKKLRTFTGALIIEMLQKWLIRVFFNILFWSVRTSLWKMQPNKHSKPKVELSQMAVHLVRARYWTINIMPIFEADAAVLGQNVGKKDKRQSVTACSYCFSFVEYIALKKECIKWTTVVNAKIEIKGWPGLNRVC